MQLDCQNDAASLLSCTVVVCTRDRVPQLERCLDSLIHLRFPRLVVHVVENGTRTGSEKVAARFNARYDFLPTPGLSRARNFAARLALTDLVAFIDDDAIADPGWLAAAAPEFADNRVGVVTGPVFSLGHRQHWRSLGERRFTVDRTTPQWFARANFGGIGHGGNLIFRRSLFESWAGFDERLGRGALLSGGEEGFALFQLIAQDWRAVYVPEAAVLHEESEGDALHAEAHQTVRDAFAFFLFVYASAPGHRMELVRYFAQALRGVRRDWRYAPAPHHLTRFESVVARIAGIPVFLRTWLNAQ
jgi:O-antigen biosynthesis protein